MLISSISTFSKLNFSVYSTFFLILTLAYLRYFLSDFRLANGENIRNISGQIPSAAGSIHVYPQCIPPDTLSVLVLVTKYLVSSALQRTTLFIE